jgi:iron complex outermembrane receptor protein
MPLPQSISKRTYLLLLMFISILPFTAAAFPPADNRLKGIVRDEHGQPLMGAVVNIPDLKTGAVTDSAGYYMISNLRQGSYLVQIQLLSYATVAKKVLINGVTEQNFILPESAIESKEVVITGQSKATQIRRSPVPIVAINTEYLKEELSTNIIDAITNVPGITAVTTGPNISKPFIRGLGYNRVLTLYDGMRQEGQQWGDEHGIEVDQYSIDRVEVVKGPASLIYGSDALAGVVNLIPVGPAPEGKIIGNVTTEYQGNNGLFGGSAMASGNNHGFYWLGRLSAKEANNYQNAIDGRVYGTNFHETDATASMGLNKKWGYSHLDFGLYDDVQAIPDGSRDSVSRKFTKQINEADSEVIVPDNELNTYKVPVLHQRVQHYRVLSSNNFNIGSGHLAVNLGYERSIRQEFSHPEYADLAGLNLQLNTYTYDFKYYLPEYKGWNAVVGVNGMFQANDASQGTEFIIPSYHEFDIGPFAMVSRNFDKLDISGGVRFDSRSFNNDAMYSRPDPVTGFDKYVSNGDTTGADRNFSKYTNTFSGVTGSLGATYNFTSRFSAKANIARGFRAPNIAEISSNGVHPGTSFYQLGNVDFKPEFSLQEDIGVDYASQHFSVSAAIFNNDITNYIYNQKLVTAQGKDSIITAGYPTLAFTAGHAQLSGGELSIDIHPHPLDWLHFENSISYVNAINKGVNGKAVNDSSKYLPNIPPLHGISELRANFKKISNQLKNSFAKVQLEYYARQDHAYLEYGTETPTPGYALFNVSLGSDITDRKGRTLFDISLFANNLFDVAYQNHQNRLKYFEQYPTDPRGHTGIYSMGRNVGLRISVPLNFK